MGIMLRAFLLIVASIPAVGLAQDALHFADVSNADLVVIGTLRQDFKFPWIDGWNERGHIEIERTMKGSPGGTSVSLAWERDFRQGWCMTRPDWRGARGKRGIWVLTRNGSYYRASLFSGFLDVKYVEEVSKLL
jgi:hypothetical protein